MSPDSVILDIAIEKGSSFEISIVYQTNRNPFLYHNFANMAVALTNECKPKISLLDSTSKLRQVLG